MTFALCSEFPFLKFIIFLQHMQDIPRRTWKRRLDDKSHFIPPDVAWRNDREKPFYALLLELKVIVYDEIRLLFVWTTLSEFGNHIRIFDAQMLLRRINWKMSLLASGKYENIYFFSIEKCHKSYEKALHFFITQALCMQSVQTRVNVVRYSHG